MGNLSGVLATQDSSDVPVMKTGVIASSGFRRWASFCFQRGSALMAAALIP